MAMVSQFCADLVFAHLFGSATCAGFCRTPVKASAESAPLIALYVLDPVSIQVQQGLSTTRGLHSAVYPAWGYRMVTSGSLSCKGLLCGHVQLSFLHGGTVWPRVAVCPAWGTVWSRAPVFSAWPYRMVTLRCCASHAGKLRNNASQARSMADADGYDAEEDESYGGQEGRRRSRGHRGDRQDGRDRRSRGNDGDGGSKGCFGLRGEATSGEFSCTPLNVAYVLSYGFST